MWRLLGPVTLAVDGRDIDLGPGKQRCVIAVLLATPGRTVPVGTLVDRVWGDRPPRASNALAPYVARLRQTLRRAAPGDEMGVLRYVAGGYRIECDPDLVDLHRARRLAEQARSVQQAGDE